MSSNETDIYHELKQQIHDDLRAQHPEWIALNGECPNCDAYESRLSELLAKAAKPSESL